MVLIPGRWCVKCKIFLCAISLYGSCVRCMHNSHAMCVGVCWCVCVCACVHKFLTNQWFLWSNARHLLLACPFQQKPYIDAFNYYLFHTHTRISILNAIRNYGQVVCCTRSRFMHSRQSVTLFVFSLLFPYKMHACYSFYSECMHRCFLCAILSWKHPDAKIKLNHIPNLYWNGIKKKDVVN